MDYLPFVDISYAQGEYNMGANSDQIIAMKASGGDGVTTPLYLDAQLVRNYANATAAGKVPILYHFAGGGDPTVEASYFISAASPLADGDVYALDWEIEHTDPVGWVNTFMNHVHAVTGAWPLIYMDISRLNAYDWSSVLENCGLWLAAPSFGFDDTIPEVSKTYVAQQGPIVNGVDSDAAFMTLEEVKEYAYHTPVSQPVSQPAPAPTPPAAPTTSPSSSASPSQGPVENPDGSTTIPVTVNPPTPPEPGTVITPTTPIEHKPWEDDLEEDVKMALGKYNKFIVAIAGTLVSFLSAHYGASAVVKDVVYVLTALGVYQFKNSD